MEGRIPAVSGSGSSVSPIDIELVVIIKIWYWERKFLYITPPLWILAKFYSANSFKKIFLLKKGNGENKTKNFVVH